ncbi:MAG: pyridoxal phosphate-dependent aminotransferase [Candidatus Methanomethylicaceae archaeon]
MSNRVQNIPRGEREELLAIARKFKDVISLGRGDPDLNTPKVIVDAAIQALREGCTHYTHWAGLLELRQAIAQKLLRDNNLRYDPETEIVVTAGAQEAINVVFQTLINPGDEILIPDPYYTPYETAAKLAGGIVRHVPLDEKQAFVLQPEDLEEHIGHKTKILIINSPHNPTGTVMPAEILAGIADIAIKHDLLVISDEIYEKLVYDDYKHISIASFPGMRERTVVINGFSKAYSMTGWRVGYFAAPSDFVAKASMIKYTFTISAPHAAQFAALAALSPEGQATIPETVAIYDERRRYMIKALAEMGLSYRYPAGTFYIFVDVRPTGRNSFSFCRDLLLDAHVLVLPGTAYGNAEGYVRLSLVVPLEQLKVAAQRMGEVVQKYIAEARGEG